MGPRLLLDHRRVEPPAPQTTPEPGQMHRGAYSIAMPPLDP
jgi:hypothetical protein